MLASPSLTSAGAIVPTTMSSKSFSPHETISNLSEAWNQKKNATTQSAFLALPVEILQMILRQLLLSPEPLAQLTKRRIGPKERSSTEIMFRRWHYQKRASLNIYPQVLGVCDYLYVSGWQILHRQNTWMFHICHTTYGALEFVDALSNGNAFRIGDPFNSIYSRLPPAVANMQKFSLDIQLEHVDFRRSRVEDDHFRYVSDELRNLLTGSDKEIEFQFRSPPMADGKSTMKLNDEYVADLASYFAAFKGVRARSVRVYVGGVQYDTELARVMMSDEAVDETLPDQLDALQEYVDEFKSERWLPNLFDKSCDKAETAVDTWDSEEFRRRREMMLDMMDEMLEAERAKLNDFRTKL